MRADTIGSGWEDGLARSLRQAQGRLFDCVSADYAETSLRTTKKKRSGTMRDRPLHLENGGSGRGAGIKASATYYQLRATDCHLWTVDCGGSSGTAMPGFLMFFRSGGNPHAAEFFAVIFAEQDVPLFAAFDDLFLLGSDALADFDFDFFFLAQNISDALDDVLADGIAVLDKFDFVGLHQQISDLVRDAHNFFAAQSHVSSVPLFCSLAQNQFTVARDLTFDLLEHILIRDACAAHFVLMLRENGAGFFVDFIFHGDFVHHARAHLGDDRLDILLFNFNEIRPRSAF